MASITKPERSTAASEYNNKYQIQLNKHISRKSNLTTGDQSQGVQILDSGSSDHPFPSYTGKNLMINSKQNTNIKYMHLRNTRANQISNNDNKN